MVRMYRNAVIMIAALAFGACTMTGASNDGMPQQKSGTKEEGQTGTHMKAQQGSPEARLLGFLNHANKGDLEGGRLAQERGDSLAVKTYG